MSVREEDLNLPPPSTQLPPPASQSHFAKFDNFAPDDDAPFDHEFARLASSQRWVLGSQQYTQERTIAIREELRLLYFSQSQPLADVDGGPEELTQEQKLRGYRDLCNEVGIPPSDSIEECKKHLKSTLVNIVDLIDARRTCSVAKVWHDFDAFRKYTLQDEHRINKEEAKKGEGYLASLLQDFGTRGRRKRNDMKRNAADSRVVTGRVGKVKPRMSQRKRRRTLLALR